ncbi:hypothetical protein [Brevibacillus laterosporus]|uniref:hypothetical protein n=1 Tax=Brevibacillus laterosporus TaxID=1465 RepID=UPI0018F899E5|nr:hypothetical protein [Brevibacillus laterosporus]MBG9773037.1 hypothetical protein [Brevibacillus laterosporus]
MFRQVYGFDPDVFKVGQAINIDDSEITIETNRHAKYIDWGEKAYEYYEENMSGTYLIVEVDVLSMELKNMFKGAVTMPIRHFTGENPRMTIKILE